jgi:hypothetical protein
MTEKNKNIELEFSLDSLKILEEDEDCSIVQLDLLHLGTNRNKCNISKECVEKSLPTFFNKPIIYRLNNQYFPEQSTDVVEHARNEEQENTTYIAGTIPESSTVQYIDRDGKTYLRMIGVIHKLYQPILLNILKKRNGETKVSIELKVIEGKQDVEGILVIDSFKFLSVCLLGTFIKEGIENSQLVVTKFSLNKTIEQTNKSYLTFTQKKQELLNKNNKYEIPIVVKNNALNSLDLKKKYGRGMTSIGKSMANYLINNSSIEKDKINDIFKYFSKHEQDNIDSENISNEYISWLAFGGNEGYDWLKNIVQKQNIKKEVFISKDKKDNDLDIEHINNKSEEVNELKKVVKKDEDKVENTENTEVVENNATEESQETEKNSMKFSTSNQIYEILDNAVSTIKYIDGIYECHKYWVSDYDAELSIVYVYDCEEGKKFQAPYTISNDVATINFDEKKPVISNGYKIVSEVSDAIIDNAIDNCDGKETVKNDGEQVDNSNEEIFKKKCESLEKECDTLKNELQKYKDEEVVRNAKEEKEQEKEKMNNLLQEYSHCFSNEEIDDIKKCMDESSFADFEAKVDNKIKEFALKMKKSDKNNKNEVEESKDDKEKKVEDEEFKNALQFSVSPFGVTSSYDFSKNLGEGGLDSIIKNSGVKIK